MDKIQIAKRIRESIKSGQLNTLRDLLEREPKMLEYVTPFGTWLHVATAHGHLEIIEYLVNSGIDIHAKGGTFSTNVLERAATKDIYILQSISLNIMLKWIQVNRIEVLCLLQYIVVILKLLNC